MASSTLQNSSWLSRRGRVEWVDIRGLENRAERRKVEEDDSARGEYGLTSTLLFKSQVNHSQLIPGQGGQIFMRPRMTPDRMPCRRHPFPIKVSPQHNLKISRLALLDRSVVTKST